MREKDNTKLSNNLMSIRERLNNPGISKTELSQRKLFIDAVKFIRGTDLKVLSASVGDGIWDYILLKTVTDIKEIIATDVVDCPVSHSDQCLLQELTDWKFLKLESDRELPFATDEFDLIIHHDVVEHTEKPHLFLSEQYRCLKPGGSLIFTTPNLFRPANIIKLVLGRLIFPATIGFTREIGPYTHVQEFYEQHMNLLLREVGFQNVKVAHAFWGLHFLSLCFSMFPHTHLGKSMCHYLLFSANK